MADKNAVALCDLMKELKVNLVETQKLWALYHSKHIKEAESRAEKSVWLSDKYIKIKRNLKL